MNPCSGTAGLCNPGFIDDVSGNILKQWNQHYCGTLLREMVDEESNVQFVATSPSVSAMELMQGIQESLE